MRSFFTRSAPKAPPTGPKNPPPVQPRTTIMSQLDDFESDGGGEFRSEEDEDEPPPDDADEFSEDPPEDDDDEGDFEDAEEYEEDEEDIEEDDEDDPPPDDDDEDVDPPDDEEEDELEDPDEEEEFEEDDEIDEDEDDEEEEDDVDDDPPSPPPLKRENSSRLPPPPPVIRDIPPPQPPIKQNNPPPPGPPPRNDDNRISMKAPPPPQIKPPVFDNRESNNIAPPIRPPPAIKPPVLPPRTVETFNQLIDDDDEEDDDDDDDLPPPPPEMASNIPFAKVNNDSLSAGLNISKKTQLGQEDKRQSTSLSTLFNDESFRNSLSLSKSLVIPLTEADSNRRFSSRMSFINNTISSSAPSPNTITVNTPVVNNDTKESDKKEKDGYLEVQGKFEGDPFEILYIKPTKTNMFVRVITGEEASFDLTKNSYVYEDIDDPKCFVLDYAGNMIVFKVKTRDELTAILAAMPRKVFEAPADNDPPPPPIDSSLTATVKSNKPFNYSDEENDSSKANVKHIKGTSVEELLEGSIIPMNSDELDKIFSKSPTRRQSLFTIESNRKSKAKRKELINTYIKKPIVSIRRVKQLCKWINSLYVWENQINILNIHQNFCNGILLLNILSKYISIPNYNIEKNKKYKILNEKTAIENIEKGIGLIWRSKSVNNSHIPKPMDIFKGNISKLIVLIQELFDIHVRKLLFSKAIKILKWYTSVLRQYDRPLPIDIFAENDLSDLWSYFQSGVSLFDIIYHFNGPVTIGTDSKKVTIDPLRITSNPKSISEFRANSNYVFSLLKALSIEVLWDADDWITYPDTEFILLQLQLIYDKFSTSQCSLPPANGTVAGITSGPNGEPRVVGLIYADTLLSNRVSVERMAKGVLVGIGEDALPLLPIDNSHLVKSRYYAPTLPQGLMSFMASSVKVIHSSIQLREKVNDKNKEWNSSHAVDRVSRDRHHKDEGLLNILRSVSKPITSTIPAADISMDPTKDTIHSSARKTRKSVIDRSIGTTRRASSIPQVTISTLENVKSLDDLNKLLEKQYDDLIQTLDNDLKDSIDEMNKQEDDLTHRYNELEEISERVTQKDYERILNQLEIEKLQLESERIRVKEHYELRKISISKQHNETASRMRAKFEENSKPITVVNTTPFSKTKAITKKAEVNLSNVEKGWIKTFTKKNTHNIHLNRMQNQSINNVKATWTPDKYKGKEKQQPTNKSFISSDSNKNIFTTDELTINDKTDNSSLNSYNLFKIYLHNVTKKWIDNQKPVSTKLDTSLESSNVNKSKSNLISLPNKVPNDWGILPNKVVNDDSNDAFDAIGTAIRKEENDRLQYEDERRRTYLAQLYTEANGIPPSNLIYGQSVDSSSVATEIDYSVFDNLDNQIKNEVEDAIAFLETPRVIMNNNDEYIWKIIKSKNLNNKLIYSLQWSQIVNGVESIKGIVDIINSIEIFESIRDPLTLTILIGNSIESLKSTSGKPFLYLQFQSAELCHKYKLALKSLQQLDV